MICASAWEGNPRAKAEHALRYFLNFIFSLGHFGGEFRSMEMNLWSKSHSLIRSQVNSNYM